MFGTRSAALRRIDEREARKAGLELRKVQVHVGRLPASRQGRTIYAPENDVVVGAPMQGCADDAAVEQAIGTQGMRIPCDANVIKGQPRPSGSGDVNVTAGGANTAMITTVKPAVVVDYGINDPTGVLLVTSILAGDVNLILGGSIRTNTWQSAKTACPINKPFPIYPWSGLIFAFSNTTGQDIKVNVWALLRTVDC